MCFVIMLVYIHGFRYFTSVCCGIESPIGAFKDVVNILGQQIQRRTWALRVEMACLVTYLGIYDLQEDMKEVFLVV